MPLIYFALTLASNLSPLYLPFVEACLAMVGEDQPGMLAVAIADKVARAYLGKLIAYGYGFHHGAWKSVGVFGVKGLKMGFGSFR